MKQNIFPKKLSLKKNRFCLLYSLLILKFPIQKTRRLLHSFLANLLQLPIKSFLSNHTTFIFCNAAPEKFPFKHDIAIKLPRHTANNDCNKIGISYVSFCSSNMTNQSIIWNVHTGEHKHAHKTTQWLLLSDLIIAHTRTTPVVTESIKYQTDSWKSSTNIYVVLQLDFFVRPSSTSILASLTPFPFVFLHSLNCKVVADVKQEPVRHYFIR